MPPLSDEKILNFDGFLGLDPAEGIRQQAQELIASRKWSTDQVWFGDQYEPTDPYGDDSPPEPDEEVETIARWNMCFNLGLDHAKRNASGWFADVEAILELLQHVCSSYDPDAEFTVEVRSNSKVWYSETVGYVSTEPLNLERLRARIECLIFGKWPA